LEELELAKTVVVHLLLKEGFNPKHWEIKENYVDNEYTIQNLDDSVEFGINVYYADLSVVGTEEEQVRLGIKKSVLMYDVFDGYEFDTKDADSIKECIELGQVLREEHHSGWTKGMQTSLYKKQKELNI